MFRTMNCSTKLVRRHASKFVSTRGRMVYRLCRNTFRQTNTHSVTHSIHAGIAYTQSLKLLKQCWWRWQTFWSRFAFTV